MSSRSLEITEDTVQELCSLADTIKRDARRQFIGILMNKYSESLGPDRVLQIADYCWRKL